MVSVCLQGGLANRMFQYAFYRSVIAKGWPASVDNYSFTPRKRMTFEAVNLKDAFPDLEIYYTPNGKFRFSCVYGVKGKILRCLNNIITKEKYLFEPFFKYCPHIYDSISDNCQMIGLWQTEEYFSDIVDDIRKQFTFLPFTEEKNLKVCDLMKTENSVAIHIRKGNDYINDKLWDGTCPVGYYYDAIDYIKKYVKDPHFYLFTDNLQWVKDNIRDINYTVVDWNPIKGKYNFRDMQLMSCAKHNIISNSSYSWWGAWLNPYPGKIVVAPKVWFNPQIESYRDNNIVCDDWISI